MLREVGLRVDCQLMLDTLPHSHYECREPAYDGRLL